VEEDLLVMVDVLDEAVGVLQCGHVALAPARQVTQHQADVHGHTHRPARATLLTDVEVHLVSKPNGIQHTG